MLVSAAVDDRVVERGTEAGYPDALAVEEATNQCLDVVARSEEIQETADGIQEITNLGDGATMAPEPNRSKVPFRPVQEGRALVRASQ